MGLAASQARLLSLTARRSNLEYRGQDISERRIQISSEIQALHERKQTPNTARSITPQDIKNFFGRAFKFMCKVGQAIYDFLKAFAKEQKKNDPTDIDEKIKALEAEDKKLELTLKTIDTQHNSVQTEYEGVKKVIDKNIETSFKVFSGN